MATVSMLTPSSGPKVAFQKSEMNRILNVYGKMVMAGQAKDYAIGMYRDHAVFAIFRRHAEAATWRIEKVPALRSQQGAYVVYGSQNQVLKRGHDLEMALRVFDTRKFEVVGGSLTG